MKILIATGIFPPDIGGPAKYAQNVYEEFKRRGHEVVVVPFGSVRHLPPGVRHCAYFIKLLRAARGVEWVLALDLFSSGFPAFLAARARGAKYAVRVGGDFVWEAYIERTGAPLTISEFYRTQPRFTFKERIISAAVTILLTRADALVFNTAWQRDVLVASKRISSQRAFVVENFYPEKCAPNKIQRVGKKVFLWAGRPSKVKNIERLKRAFAKAAAQVGDIELVLFTDASSEALQEQMQKCWAIVLPSLSDVGPNLIMESLAFSKPFILTRETGLLDRLGDVGIFVDPLDENALAEAFLVLADSERHTQYVHKVEQFRFTHSWEQIADEFLTIFTKV